MRYQEISGKEMIDMSSGTRLGILGQTDLNINPETGKIESFILPNYKWFGFKKEEARTEIGWETIKKIGNDIILLELDEHTKE